MKKVFELERRFGTYDYIGNNTGWLDYEFFLCGRKLREFFKFPKETEKLYLILSNEPMKESYKCEHVKFTTHLTLSDGETKGISLPVSADIYINKLFGECSVFYVRVEYNS